MPLLAILALGFAIRLFIIARSGSPPETQEHHQIVQNLLSGKGYIFVTHDGTVYRSFYSGVFYIWLTVVLYTLFPPGQTAMLMAQSVSSVLLAAVVFFIGRRLWNESVGLLAALGTMTHPALAYFDTQKIHPLSFDCFTTALALLALLWMRRSRRPIAPWLAGLVGGIALLQRATLLLVIPFGLFWLWRFSERDGRLRRRMVGYLMGALLVVGPWVARNVVIHGAPILLTTTGEHFWIGNAPASYGSNYLPSGRSVLGTTSPKFYAAISKSDEMGQFRLFWRAGLENAKAHPWRTLSKMGWKFLYFWSFAPQTGLWYPRIYLYLYAPYYAFLFAFAVQGARRLASVSRSQPEAFSGFVLILAALFSTAVIHSVLYFELHHRWSIEPLLIVFSSIGLVSALLHLEAQRG